MSKPPQSAPTASTLGPCPTLIQISRTPRHWKFTQHHPNNPHPHLRGGRMVRRCWVNFQCQGVLLTWLTVGQGPTVLSVGAGRGCLDILSLIYHRPRPTRPGYIFILLYHFSPLSPSLWETARYRLKYCLNGPLSPKQPTNPPAPNVSPTRIQISRIGWLVVLGLTAL